MCLAREDEVADAALDQRTPTDEEVAVASQAASVMASALTVKGLPFTVRHGGGDVQVDLSPSLGQLVLDVLTHVGRGRMVTVLPYDVDLTTKEAADLLNVSRPHLTKLLTDGRIPFHKVGSHRRVRAEDVVMFRAHREAERADALDELQRLGQEFDAG